MVLRYTELPPQAGFARQKVSFTWGKRTKTVSGVLRLAQTVIKMLLTTPGTDSFYVESGTILPGLVHRGVTRSSQQSIKMDATISVQDLERQIQDIQAGLSIPDDERLRELRIRRIEYLPVTAEWIVDITVISYAGTAVTIDVAPYLKGK